MALTKQQAAPTRVSPQWIAKRSTNFGLDPRAVLAVARTEGLGGGIGDQGTSFGPFQLHYGGAYPSWAPRGTQASQAWAWSPEGINYALSKIGTVARGLTGEAAVRKIVTDFERPANIPGQISKALSYYGTTPAIQSVQTGFSAPLDLSLGTVIGTPFKGTHTLGNWQSDNAVDVRVPVGTPIYAVENGTIGPRFGALTNDTGRFGGLRLTLQGAHDNYWYGHMSKYAPGIKPGAQVRKGQLIGYSGEANGVPHLHFASEHGVPTQYLSGVSGGAGFAQSNVPFTVGQTYGTPLRSTSMVTPSSLGAAPRPSTTDKAIAQLLKFLNTPYKQPNVSKAANAAVMQAINAGTAPLLAAQAKARADALRNATGINQAAQAAAAFLKPLGDETAADYRAALGAQTGIAQGFSGDLRETAAAEAAAGQEMLASVPGNVQQVSDRSTDLANVLYGTAGALPANALQARQAAAVSAARAVPGQMLAYGQTQANAAINQGQKAAEEYQLRIAEIAAQAPTLRREYVSDLQSQAAEDYQNKIENTLSLLKIAQTQAKASAANTKWIPGRGLYNLDTGRLMIPAAPDIHYTSQGDVLRENPDGTVTVLRSGGAGAGPGFSLSPGQTRYDPYGNPIASLPATPTTAGKGKVGGRTASQWDQMFENATGYAQSLLSGTKEFQWTTGEGKESKFRPVPGSGTGPIPVDQYRTALQLVLDQGPGPGEPGYKKWATRVTNIVAGIYRVPRTLPEQLKMARDFYRFWTTQGGIGKKTGKYIPIEELGTAMYMRGLTPEVIYRTIPAGVRPGGSLQTAIDAVSRNPPPPARPGAPSGVPGGAKPSTGPTPRGIPGSVHNPRTDPILFGPIGGDVHGRYRTSHGFWVSQGRYVKGP